LQRNASSLLSREVRAPARGAENAPENREGDPAQ
jgi:hypothetical protein